MNTTVTILVGAAFLLVTLASLLRDHKACQPVEEEIEVPDTPAQHTTVMRLELDDKDYEAVMQAIAFREHQGVLPFGGGNLNGRIIAEICRVYGRMVNLRKGE